MVAIRPERVRVPELSTVKDYFAREAKACDPSHRFSGHSMALLAGTPKLREAAQLP
jgi:hypothetical protein